MQATTQERLKEALKARNMLPIELSRKSGIGKSAISQYVSGKVTPKQDKIYKLAQALKVNEPWLMGYDEPMDAQPPNVDLPNIPNIFPLKTKKVPLLGTIAAGIPIYAEENFDGYRESTEDVRADFCLKIKGDSMIGARINDGDIVFIRKQPDVENGEIAAVLIDGEATLKRVYKKNGSLVLQAENPKYAPIVCSAKTCDECIIMGKAVTFQSDVV